MSNTSGIKKPLHDPTAHINSTIEKCWVVMNSSSQHAQYPGHWITAHLIGEEWATLNTAGSMKTELFGVCALNILPEQLTHLLALSWFLYRFSGWIGGQALAFQSYVWLNIGAVPLLRGFPGFPLSQCLRSWGLLWWWKSFESLTYLYQRFLSNACVSILGLEYHLYSSRIKQLFSRLIFLG